MRTSLYYPILISLSIHYCAMPTARATQATPQALTGLGHSVSISIAAGAVGTKLYTFSLFYMGSGTLAARQAGQHVDRAVDSICASVLCCQGRALRVQQAAAYDSVPRHALPTVYSATR